MGKLLLIFRLAAADLRRRRAEAVLLLVALTAATTTLTLGLALHGVTSAASYQQTRAATRGPDIVVTDVTSRQLPSVLHQIQAPGLAARGGPYPVASGVLRTRGYTAGFTAEGRSRTAARIDQPQVTQGTWVRPGGVVLERSFADALGVRAGTGSCWTATRSGSTGWRSPRPARPTRTPATCPTTRRPAWIPGWSG
jgi:putative ABC transport system permease protein